MLNWFGVPGSSLWGERAHAGQLIRRPESRSACTALEDGGEQKMVLWTWANRVHERGGGFQLAEMT